MLDQTILVELVMKVMDELVGQQNEGLTGKCMNRWMQEEVHWLVLTG